MIWVFVCLALLLPACSMQMPSASPNGIIQTSEPFVVLFRADPSKIENGAVVRLHWEVINADRVMIDNGIGAVPVKGSMEVKPHELTAYNLTATNVGGSVASAVMVNVTPFVRVASPAFNPLDMQQDTLVSGLPHLQQEESYVFFQGAVMVGADEHLIVLRNNTQARNPTWEELKAFLRADSTDRHAYQPGIFTCGDFAEMLHNNAEAAGIRAAIVAVKLEAANVPGGSMNHSLNAFETTDRGLIYVDATSSTAGFFADKLTDLIVGKEYICVSLDIQPGQLQTWPSMGIIKAIDIFQW